jgi:hypothetical protein
MELQQRRPNPEAKLGPPPSGNLGWFSTLRRKLPRHDHSGDVNTAALRVRVHAKHAGPQQQPDRRTTTPLIEESSLPATIHVVGDGDRMNVVPKAQGDSLAQEHGIAGKQPDTKPPSKIGTDPGSQSGLHFDSAPITTRSEPTKASQSQIVWDGKTPYRPESMEQAKYFQKQGITAESPYGIEAPLNDIHRNVNNRLRQGNVEQERDRVKEERRIQKQKRSEWAKEHVWQILRNNLRGAESISGSVLVETELRDTQQMLIVKCFGPAASRVGDIRNLLEKTKRGLSLQGFILSVREESQRGTNFSLLWGPGPLDDVVPGLSESAPMTVVSDQSSRRDNTPRNVTYHEADRFANTPYWNSTSILVDCLFPPRPQLAANTLCGALVRMTSWEEQGEPQLRTWTCGGLIHVNGVPYALTTAHPLLLNNRGKDQDGVGITEPSVVTSVFPAEHGIFSEGVFDVLDETQSWQTLGRVYKHAMSKCDRVPANYDWLLIEIAKDYILPNFPADHKRDDDLGARSGKTKSGNSRSVSICTWRGPLQARLLPGLSFMIIGESSFKTMKLSVDEPMGESAFTVTVHATLD